MVYLVAWLVIAGMFCIPLLVAWAARGRWQDAIEAAKGMAWCWALLFVIPMAIGAVMALLAFIVK